LMTRSPCHRNASRADAAVLVDKADREAVHLVVLAVDLEDRVVRVVDAARAVPVGPAVSVLLPSRSLLSRWDWCVHGLIREQNSFVT